MTIISKNLGGMAPLSTSMLCEVTFTTTTSLSWNEWFHFTTSTSKLVSGSVLRVFESMVHWLFNCFILYDAAHTYAKKFSWEVHVEATRSRELTFHVKYVNAIMFAKISGGTIARFCLFLVATLQTVILRLMETHWKTLVLSTRNLSRWITLNFMNNNYDIKFWRIFIELIIKLVFDSRCTTVCWRPPWILKPRLKQFSCFPI